MEDDEEEEGATEPYCPRLMNLEFNIQRLNLFSGAINSIVSRELLAMVFSESTEDGNLCGSHYVAPALGTWSRR